MLGVKLYRKGSRRVAYYINWNGAFRRQGGGNLCVVGEGAVVWMVMMAVVM